MLLSIIVPVYKVEPYLRRCVESILSQTMSDFELILVDDGSPDACPAICNEYAAKDARVTVIHQANKGVSTARNRGLEIAKGDWITFVDSDDYLVANAYELLLNAAEAESCDMAIMDWAFVDEQDRIVSGKERQYGDTVYLNQKQVYQKQFDIPATIRTSMINKVFRRHVLQGLCYDPEMHCCEDTYLCSLCLERVERAVYIRQPLYRNVQRQGSAMHGGLRAVDYAASCAVHKRIAERAAQLYEDIGHIAFAFYIDQCIWKMREQMERTDRVPDDCIKQHKQAVTDMRNRLLRESWNMIRCKELTFKQKIRFILIGLGI